MNTQDPTQKLTQSTFTKDPSMYEDNSDVLCILHPSSAAAIRIVKNAVAVNSEHLLRRPQSQATADLEDLDSSENDADPRPYDHYRDVSISSSQEPRDLALRFSSSLLVPAIGFVFGRNATVCDIDLSAGMPAKRISGQHFRIFVNADGVLMLEDSSTNGTIVDTYTIGGKRLPQNCKTRILTSGSVIEILSPIQDEFIKFILSIPSQDGHFAQYERRYQSFMTRMAIAQKELFGDSSREEALEHSRLGPPRGGKWSMVAPSGTNHGMMWDGGGQYKCVGLLGKGAFAMVYQVASKSTGEVFAAKEMEKQRFVRNGILDRRIDNEMKIMAALKHPHIVQFMQFVLAPSTIVILMEHVPCGDLSTLR